MSDEQACIRRAIAGGHAEITGEGKSERILYKAADHSERWVDPEEKVRAEFWAELIYKYEYQPERIRFERADHLYMAIKPHVLDFCVYKYGYCTHK